MKGGQGSAAGDVNLCVNDKETPMPYIELRSACAGNQSTLARCCSCRVQWLSSTVNAGSPKRRRSHCPTSARRRNRQACAANRCDHGELLLGCLAVQRELPRETSDVPKIVGPYSSDCDRELVECRCRPCGTVSHALWNTMLEAAGKQRAYVARGSIERKKRGCQWRG